MKIGWTCRVVDENPSRFSVKVVSFFLQFVFKLKFLSGWSDHVLRGHNAADNQHCECRLCFACVFHGGSPNICQREAELVSACGCKRCCSHFACRNCRNEPSEECESEAFELFASASRYLERFNFFFFCFPFFGCRIFGFWIGWYLVCFHLGAASNLFVFAQSGFVSLRANLQALERAFEARVLLERSIFGNGRAKRSQRVDEG
jgi:hypothetical protein